MNRSTPRSESVRFDQRSLPLQKQFQLRYTTIIVIFVFIGISCSVLPVVYFFNQNYEMFIRMAYDHSPKLVQYLEQEKQWLNSYLLTMAVASVIFCVVFSRHVTQRIINPILVLQTHIKTLVRGNWKVKEVTIRDNDEFRDLIANYNYLYYCLRQLTKEDITKLQSLVVDAQNSNAHATWQKMIEDKSQQIGFTATTDPSSKPSPSRDSRHAS